MIEILLDLKDYDQDNAVTVFHRIAARAIVKRGDKYLVVYGKDGDCKFPGGGQEEGETLIDTMIRETREETGYQVVDASVKREPVYKIHEISKGEKEDMFIMDSYYFECQVEDEQNIQKLDEYEADLEYMPDWLTLDEIRTMNAKAVSHENLRWVRRELLVTEKLIESMEANK